MRVWMSAMLVVFLLQLADGARACTCEIPAPEQAMERADLVFFGRVSGFFRGMGPEPAGQQHWEIEVEGVWKGPVQPQIRIYAHDFDGVRNSCDMSLVEGDRYLIYAYVKKQSPNRYRVRSCSRTTKGASSLRDLLFLGQPPHRFE